MRTQRRNLTDQQSIIHTFFRDDDGNIVIWQVPNVPLIVAMVSAVLQLLTNGRFSDLAGLIFFGSIFTWAWLEIAYGVSLFRRVLGLLVLVAIVWTRTQ
jgi:hypothetical protein